MISLVTGATGLLGNNLVRLLVARGERVRVLVRPESDSRALAGLDVDRRSAQLGDPHALRAAVEGVGRVFHAAARVWVGRRDGASIRRVNEGGTARVARACREAGVRMLHVSTVDTLGFGTRAQPASEETPPGPDWDVPYVASKRAAERAVAAELEAGLDGVIVHPVYLLGPWDWKPSSGRMLLAVAAGRALVAPPGGNDFAHVEDVAAGVLAAAERGPTGAHYVLGGEALTYREAFTLFADVTGGTPPLFTAPTAAVVAAGRLGDLWGRVRGREPEINSGSARMSCLSHHFSDGKARRELAYASRSARTAAVDAWRWFQAHGYTRRVGPG